jgi:LPS-assembly lipoprotein
MLGLVLVLSGCGFKLRGDVSLPFHSIAVNPQPGGAVAQALRRQLARTVRVLDAQTPLDQAELVLDVLGENRAVGALSTTPSGQVTQVQLTLVVRFSVRTAQGQMVLAPVDLALKQAASYSESLALSKELEQDLMFRDMQQDVVQQVLRRLSTIPAKR